MSAIVLSGLTPAGAGGDSPAIRLKRIACLNRRDAMTTRTGDPAAYVTLQQGLVLALRVGEQPTIVLDLTKLVRVGGEQGLLGLAFSPDGDQLYVHYSGAAAGETVLEEYEFADGRARPGDASGAAHLPATAGEPQRR